MEIEESLREFLSDLFQRSSPERIALHLVSGRGCAKLGPVVKQIEYPGGPKLSDSEIARLSADLTKSAQKDCRSLGYAQRYGVLAFQFSKSDTYCGRFILPMRPRN